MAVLFDFSTFTRSAGGSRPAVQTPLGPLLLEVAMEGRRSSDLPFDAWEGDKPSDSGFVFFFEKARVELLICPVSPDLPPGRRVDRCLACVLRVASEADITALEFRCAWPDEFDPPAHGGYNGESLQAFTWDDGKTEVSLGTLDDEGLSGDAGTRLPVGWRQPLVEAEMRETYVGSIENRGIFIRPPRLRTGESCELYFAIAWSAFSENRSDTWFAVDLSYRDELRCWPGQQPFLARSR